MYDLWSPYHVISDHLVIGLRLSRAMKNKDIKLEMTLA